MNASSGIIAPQYATRSEEPNAVEVVVQDAVDSSDVLAYYEVYKRLVDRKGSYRSFYPVELFFELIKIRGAVRLLVAKSKEQVIAGGLFFCDGESVMYWHGASDRAYSHLFPSCAVLDEVIRWSCENGVRYFNFGNSGGIISLEKFKSYWGANFESNWVFGWTNPLWACLAYVKNYVKKRMVRSIA